MRVFVLERGIAIADEFDRNDVPGVTYVVIYDGDEPVATGRFLREDEDSGRLTRIATLADYRGQHLGSQVVTALERFAQNQHVRHLEIHAEATAITNPAAMIISISPNIFVVCNVSKFWFSIVAFTIPMQIDIHMLNSGMHSALKSADMINRFLFLNNL